MGICSRFLCMGPVISAWLPVGFLLPLSVFLFLFLALTAIFFTLSCHRRSLYGVLTLAVARPSQASAIQNWRQNAVHYMSSTVPSNCTLPCAKTRVLLTAASCNKTQKFGLWVFQLTRNQKSRVPIRSLIKQGPLIPETCDIEPWK